MRRLLCALALAGPIATTPVRAEPILLAPHRAVYELTLDGSRGARTIEAGRGRIAFEFTGSACEGYSLTYRQVTVLESSESGAKTSDLRTSQHESGDGRSFRFRNDSKGASDTSVVDGEADKSASGQVSVRIRLPKRDSYTADGEPIFPNAQMRDLIAAARAGRTTVSEKLFDGSDDGRKVYDTLAVIGKRIEPGPAAGLEEAARQPELARMPRWPVTLSYFTPGRSDGTPVYVLSFELYDNGVSRALRLDYGDFALKGEMKRLDLLPADKGCQR
jgi:hypothetical protein